MKDKLIRQLQDRQSRLGIGKAALAQRSGVSRKMLYLFERRRNDLSVDKLLAVADALGLRIELVEDVQRLPADYRAQKTQKQAAFLNLCPRISLASADWTRSVLEAMVATGH